jgi:hypothetical protein
MSGDKVGSFFFNYDAGEAGASQAWMHRVLFDIASIALQSTPDEVRGTEMEQNHNMTMLRFYFEDLNRAREDAVAVGDEARRIGMCMAQIQVACAHNRLTAGEKWRGLAAEITDIREDEYQRTYDESIAASAEK